MGRPFRKIWDVEKDNFLMDHKDEAPDISYPKFLEAFGLTSDDVTYIAFKNERSRIGAVKTHNPHPSTHCRELYAEQVKKGYVRIKVAQPNVWIMKQRWVYEETHPGHVHEYGMNYVFLDGNTRNFAPENIDVLYKSECPIFQLLGGTVAGHPELTRLNILRARVKISEMNLIATTDDVSFYNSKGRRCRRSKKRTAQIAKKHYYKDVELTRAKRREYWKRKWENMTEEQKEAYRAYRREYSHKYYERRKNGVSR